MLVFGSDLNTSVYKYYTTIEVPVLSEQNVYIRVLQWLSYFCLFFKQYDAGGQLGKHKNGEFWLKLKEREWMKK
jgi:hypothetical protein